VGTRNGDPEVPELPSVWGYNTEVWSSRLRVGPQADSFTLWKEVCWESSARGQGSFVGLYCHWWWQLGHLHFWYTKLIYVMRQNDYVICLIHSKDSVFFTYVAYLIFSRLNCLSHSQFLRFSYGICNLWKRGSIALNINFIIACGIVMWRVMPPTTFNVIKGSWWHYSVYVPHNVTCSTAYLIVQ
jgi:hypothetical protein